MFFFPFVQKTNPSNEPLRGVELEIRGGNTGVTKHVVGTIKWRNPHLHKLYEYVLCKGKPTPKIPKIA